MSEAPSPAASRPTRRFRPASASRLTDLQKRRQATLMDAAWRAFGDRARTIAFLNDHDDALGGRPLDLAIDDEAGLAAVVARLAAVAPASDTSAERHG